MHLKDKTFLITGASSGIGYGLTKRLAKEGGTFALLARRVELLEELADEIRSGSVKVNVYKCDVSKKEEVVQVFRKVKEDIGVPDVAILNAGVSSKTTIDSFDTDMAETVLSVNVLGLVYCIEQLIPDFIERKSGIIAGVSSLAEARGFPRGGFYCASKAAASTFLESIRARLKEHNVKVITIKPGFVKTPMTDKNDFKMPFLISVEKASEIIYRGLRKEKSIIQFPWQTALGAKFLKLLPNAVFDYFSKDYK